LPKNDEITSTERLLGLIRNDEKGVDVPETHLMQESQEILKPHPAKSWGLRKNITVGVDFGYSDVKLVKVRQSSEKQWHLLGYRSVPLDPQISREDPEFSSFFRKTLTSFCGSSGKVALWSSVPSEGIEIRNILIPKVPKRQIANVVFWSLKKEVPFDENKSVFDFEILGDVEKEGLQRISVLAWAVPEQEVQQLKALFNRSGFPLTGLSLSPFAIQNLIRTRLIETDGKTVSALFVGRDWSRIDIFSSGNLVLVRWIKTGINSMIEGIMEKVKEDPGVLYGKGKKGEDVSVPLDIDGQISIDSKQAGRILFSLSADSPPLTGVEPGFALKEVDIYKMILPALQRLVRQVERSIRHYSLKSENDSVKKIYTVGEINSFKRVVDYIFKQVGLPGDTIDPLEPRTSFMNDVSVPGSASGRGPFAPAVGTALSNNSRTPNLLFTSDDKERIGNVRRINLGVFVVFFIIMGICLGFFMWQGYVKGQKEVRVAQLQQKLEQYRPRVDQNYIVQLTAKAKQKQHESKEYSERYVGLAIIKEITNITTPNVRLLSMKANFGQVLGDKKTKGVKTLVLEGVIFGSHQSLESSLAAYVLRLENSPLFSRPDIRKSTLGYYGDKEAMQFTVQIDMAGTQKVTEKVKGA
jgi:Tfp pilus assembly PilM family ATPase